MIKEFTKEYRFLSNFYPLPIPIIFDKISYSTNEHYYQAMKSTLPHIRHAISKLPLPAQQKKQAELWN